MKVKPVKRQWDLPAGAARGDAVCHAGASLGNMEEVAFYMQYLKALPTLKLTVPAGLHGWGNGGV